MQIVLNQELICLWMKGEHDNMVSTNGLVFSTYNTATYKTCYTRTMIYSALQLRVYRDGAPRRTPKSSRHERWVRQNTSKATNSWQEREENFLTRTKIWGLLPATSTAVPPTVF